MPIILLYEINLSYRFYRPVERYHTIHQLFSWQTAKKKRQLKTKIVFKNSYQLQIRKYSYNEASRNKRINKILIVQDSEILKNIVIVKIHVDISICQCILIISIWYRYINTTTEEKRKRFGKSQEFLFYHYCRHLVEVPTNLRKLWAKGKTQNCFGTIRQCGGNINESFWFILGKFWLLRTFSASMICSKFTSFLSLFSFLAELDLSEYQYFSLPSFRCYVAVPPNANSYS